VQGGDESRTADQGDGAILGQMTVRAKKRRLCRRAAKVEKVSVAGAQRNDGYTAVFEYGLFVAEPYVEYLRVMVSICVLGVPASVVICG
jgi:hypothetical protein